MEMSTERSETPQSESQGSIPQRAGTVEVTGEALVRYGSLPIGDLPLLVEPAVPGVDIMAWVAANRDLLEEKLRHHGGILFRGFDLQRAEDLEAFIGVFSGQSLEYRERSSPRKAVKGNIYTSTDYPPAYPIFLHNENSYQSEWPLRIFFSCRIPPATGGETPIADCRKVYARIDPEIRERFARRNWMYVRNFGEGFGLSWQTVFQTSDPMEVEEHCRRKGIDIEWKEDGGLRTCAIRPAIARHPRTGDLIWFNHATFFHISTLEPEIQQALLDGFDESDLPANTYYGDGEPIEPEVMDHLREAYREETVSFPWQKGDLLLLDNMLIAHGRAPFTGSREILVGMSEPVGRESTDHGEAR